MRYLHLSRADLGIAVQLGEHQQFSPENWHTTSAPDLCCGRTQFALKVAAAVAGHPVPDDLARLAKSVIPFKDHKALAAVLQKGRALSVDDINGIIKSFQLQHYAASPAVQVNFHRRPHLTDMEIRGLLGSKQENGQQPAHFSCDFAESHIADIVVSRYNGPVSSICDLRTPCEMKQMLFNCLDLASTTISKYSSSTHVRRDLITASPSTASQCEHTRYLKMNLADSIHALYVKAVSLLPHKALQKHLRGILVAGHCYGPMDPVSNIILNAIWYDSVYPLLEMDVEIEPDILDSQSMLRMEARSLDSLVAMVRTATGLSEHNALEYLSYKQCDLSVVLQVTTKEICYKAYDRAGQAGKHPKHLELASFLKSMTCDVLQELRSLLINEETRKGYMISDAALQQVYKILEVKNLPISPPADNPRLCPTAWKMLGCRKDDFMQKQKFLRQVLEELLCDYSNQHPWEPVPKLDVICGVKKNNRGHSKSYHINFLAYYNDAPSILWESSFQPRKSSQKESKTSFCCPLTYYSADHPYLGRCSLYELVLSKIVHPPSENYTGADCSKLGELNNYLNLRDKVPSATDSITESDFIYYDCLRDAKFAEVLNESRLSEEKKTTIRWS